MTAPTTGTPTGNTYDKYASENPVERRLLARFLRALADAMPAVPPERILEVGAGEGEIAQRVSDRYPHAGITVLDLPDPELAGEWGTLEVAGTHGDAGRLPFPERTFDLVLAIEVLEHVPDPSSALREIARVARSSVVVSVPREPVWRAANMARGRYWGALGNTPGHVNHWSARGFRHFVASELTVTATHHPFPWTVVAAHRE